VLISRTNAMRQDGHEQSQIAVLAVSRTVAAMLSSLDWASEFGRSAHGGRLSPRQRVPEAHWLAFATFRGKSVRA